MSGFLRCTVFCVILVFSNSISVTIGFLVTTARRISRMQFSRLKYPSLQKMRVTADASTYSAPLPSAAASARMASRWAVASGETSASVISLVKSEGKKARRSASAAAAAPAAHRSTFAAGHKPLGVGVWVGVCAHVGLGIKIKIIL